MPKESKMDCLTPPIISFVLAVLLNEKRIPKEIDILELQEESKEKTSYNEGVEETSEDNDDARLFE
ncbi:12628_t:CDS:2 [Rhizophagus irregularis]|nr:12628_t:CDS:2 [Rhizophagus irregularis]